MKNVSMDIDQNIRQVEIDSSTFKKIGQKANSVVLKPVAKSLCEKLSNNYSFDL